MLHGLDGEVLAEVGTVAAGVHAGQAGAHVFIDANALAVTGQCLRAAVTQRLTVEGLADGFENGVGGQFEGFSGGLQATVEHLRAGKAHAAYPALLVEQHLFRLRPGQQAYLVFLGDVLFMLGSAHVLEATAVHQIDIASTETGHLHGHVDGGIAGTEDDAAVGHGQGGQIAGLTQFADIVGGGEHAGGAFVGQAQLATGVQAKAKEHRIELLLQLGQAEVFAEHLAMADFDTADLQDEVHLALGEVIDHLVLGDSILVQTTGLGPGFEDHHIVAVPGQAMGTGQTGRPGADHGNALAGAGGALEGVLFELGMVQGIALQQADQYRGALLVMVAHARLLTEDFGRADPRATAAEDVGREDFFRRTLDVLLVDVADERGNVDVAGARVDAGRVVAIEAARGLQGGLAGVQRWRQVAEVLGQGGIVGGRSGEVVEGLDHGGFLFFSFFWEGFAFHRRQGRLPQRPVQRVPVGAGLAGDAFQAFSALPQPDADARHACSTNRTPPDMPAVRYSARHLARHASHHWPRPACPG
ncbi:hypothetical protein D3C77_347460 [compost metagenome]